MSYPAVKLYCFLIFSPLNTTFIIVRVGRALIPPSDFAHCQCHGYPNSSKPNTSSIQSSAFRWSSLLILLLGNGLSERTGINVIIVGVMQKSLWHPLLPILPKIPTNRFLLLLRIQKLCKLPTRNLQVRSYPPKSPLKGGRRYWGDKYSQRHINPHKNR